MNRKQIIETRRFISEAIDAARVRAAVNVLEANCHVVPIKIEEPVFCSIQPNMVAIECPYHMYNACRCGNCDHMISYNITDKIVYCMKDEDLQKVADNLEGKNKEKVPSGEKSKRKYVPKNKRVKKEDIYT